MRIPRNGNVFPGEIAELPEEIRATLLGVIMRDEASDRGARGAGGRCSVPERSEPPHPPHGGEGLFRGDQSRSRHAGAVLIPLPRSAAWRFSRTPA